MHEIARQLPDFDAVYTPYYADGPLEWLRRMGRVDFTLLGWKRRKECLRYLRRHQLPMDFEGKNNKYDLVLTCSDLVIPRNVAGVPLVLIQEGMTDPKRFWYWARRVLPFIPRWAAGSAYTGTSNRYDRFCVASEGYLEHFAERGADRSKMLVTGVPVLDDCRRFLHNDFPHRDYVLVCTSDSRETLRPDNRRGFILRARKLAAGRPLIFKLHPNERVARATAEIARWAPGALVYAKGSAEEMAANCSVLICQYSTLAFVGLALGKDVHSYFDVNELRRLLPMQGGVGARNIAQACRELLASQPGQRRPTAPHHKRRRWGDEGPREDVEALSAALT